MCEVVMRLPTEWVNHISYEMSEGGQMYYSFKIRGRNKKESTWREEH